MVTYNLGVKYNIGDMVIITNPAGDGIPPRERGKRATIIAYNTLRTEDGTCWFFHPANVSPDEGPW